MVALGSRLGPYEITAKLGEGGMGEVYRATDTKLKRDVAIKVLPAAFTEDKERLARFEREAQLLAQVNHPNIAAIHGLEESRGIRALVMELVEGPTLGERLESGALPLNESLSVALQIAHALEEAHEKGIIHRDLKPQNIKASTEGKVKVLDFGLAKAMDPFASAAITPSDLAHSPTVTMGGTREGVILGTAAYMSPEQARGATVDKRADIWAFGVVLYEMLAGERLFGGESVADLLGAVMRQPIDLDRLPATTPRGVRDLVRRCLERNPKNRLRDIGDARLALADALADPERATAAEPTDVASAPAARSRRGRLAWMVAGLAVGASLAVLALSWLSGAESPATSASAPRVTSLAPLTVDTGYEGEATFAPDGETIAYVADRSGDFEIYLQQVGGGDAINLTRDPADDVQPAISPDGRELAFVSTRESRLALVYRSPGAPLMGGDIWVVPVLGGLPRRIAEDGNFPSWSPDGRTIHFVRGISFRSEIRRVPATGGESTVVPVEFPEGSKPAYLFDPRVSPDGRWLLVSATESFFVAPIDGGLAVALGVGQNAIWDPSGEAILYCSAESGRNSSLWWLPFSSEGGTASAPAQPVMIGPAALERPALAGTGRRLLVTAVERTANLEALPLDAEAGTSGAEPRRLTRGRNDISFASASPDSRSIVYEDHHGSSSHLWRLDEGAEPVQLTQDPAFAESYPRWSPDGQAIAFTRRPADTPRRSTHAELWIMASDGGGPRRLTKEGGGMAWLPDARSLLFIHGAELHKIEVESGVTEKLEIDGPPVESIFTISPDGHWFVYQTNSIGDVDLALAPLAGGDARPLLRTERQDHHPSFSPSGRWLYFQPDHRNLWRIPGPAQGWREAAPEQVTHLPESGLYLEDPQLTSDGKQLFFSRIRTIADLWVVELADRRESETSPGDAPALPIR